MSSVTLIKAPQLKALIKQLDQRLVQQNHNDPFELSSLVFPNSHLKNIITWELLSTPGSEGVRSERCLSGVRKLFVSELQSLLCESFDLPSLPSSEELAWGLLARSSLSGDAISTSQLTNAYQMSELLFRLPTNVPSALKTRGLLASLPQSLESKSAQSNHQSLDFMDLWREVLSQRNLHPDELDRSLKSLCPNARSELLQTPSPEKVSGSQVKLLRRQLGAIHIVAPKALNVTLLKLLKAASAHINVTIYLLDEEPVPEQKMERLSFAQRGAFEKNRKLIERYLAPPPESIIDVGFSGSELSELPDLSERSEEEELGPSPHPVTLHRCTHDARQVEVLHEQLTTLLAEHKGKISQRDILVLVSDMKRFLPFIEYHFHVWHKPSSKKLCAVILDRGLEEANLYEQLIIMLCKLPTRHFTIQRVFELFNLTPVRHRFAIGDGRLERLKSLFESVHLKWGHDLKDREQLSGFASALHTWRFAIERLLMSELLDPLYTPTTPYLDVVMPAEALGGADYEALSTFLEFLSVLETLLKSHPDLPVFGEDKVQGSSYETWSTWLNQALDQLTVARQTDQDERLRKYMVRQAISTIEQQIQRAHVDAFKELKLTTGAVLKALNSALKSYRSVRGRSGTGITFAPISVAAGTPAKVLAFLGMEEGSFPQAIKLSLNDPLHPRHPQRLESAATESSTSPHAAWLEEAQFSPSRLESEWASFLTACSNTQERIMAFWTGTPRFNHEEATEPCGPLRYLIDRYSIPKVKDNPYWKCEPTSAYSPQGFVQMRESSSEAKVANLIAYNAAKVLAAGQTGVPVTPAHSKKYKPPASRSRSITQERLTLNNLKKCISEPQLVFLRAAGYQLTQAKAEPQGHIPLELDSLQKWSIKTELTNSFIKIGQQIEEEQWESQSRMPADRLNQYFEPVLSRQYDNHYKSLRSQSLLPPGSLGRSAYAQLWRFSVHYFWRFREQTFDYRPTPVQHNVLYKYTNKSHSYALQIPLSLYIPYDQQVSPCFIDHTVSRIKDRPDKLMTSWITHLLINRARGGEGDVDLTPFKDIRDDVVFGTIGMNKSSFENDHLEPLMTSNQSSDQLLFKTCNGYTESLQNPKSLFDLFEQVRSGYKPSLVRDFDLYSTMRKGKDPLEAALSLRESYEDYKNQQQTYKDNISSFLFGDEDYFQKGKPMHQDFMRGFKLFTDINSAFNKVTTP